MWVPSHPAPSEWLSVFPRCSVFNDFLAIRLIVVYGCEMLECGTQRKGLGKKCGEGWGGAYVGWGKKKKAGSFNSTHG